jgi:hypothetical protein
MPRAVLIGLKAFILCLLISIGLVPVHSQRGSSGPRSRSRHPSRPPRSLVMVSREKALALPGWSAQLSGNSSIRACAPTDGARKPSLKLTATPTDWSMASGFVSYSTIGNYLQVQAKAGVKIFGGVYFGPEAKFSWQKILPFQVDFFTPAVVTATPVSSQTSINMTRLGAHLSALNIGPVAIGISGGWAHSQQLGSGYYGSASLYVPF